jgi:hypothetical protein
LVAERIRPYPTVIVSITAGSLSTVGPLLDDWFLRFYRRTVDPNSPHVGISTRKQVQIEYLIGTLVQTIREEMGAVSDPDQMILAGLQVGQDEALKLHSAAVKKNVDWLERIVPALTETVTSVEAEVHAYEQMRAGVERLCDLVSRACKMASADYQRHLRLLNELGENLQRVTAPLLDPPRNERASSATKRAGRRSASARNKPYRRKRLGPGPAHRTR